MAMTNFSFSKKDKSVTLKGKKWLVENSIAVVVILTGMEEHIERYDDFALFLNTLAYDVYGFDQLGQGNNVKSEEELGIWPMSAFRITVNAVDEFISLTPAIKKKPVYLFGHSLGSFMVQEYMQRYSNHISKAVMSGTDGPNFMAKLGYMLSKMIVTDLKYNQKIKLFDDMVFGKFAKSIKNSETPFDWLSYNKENVRKYIDDPYCGYRSTAGFYREFLKALNRLYKDKFMKKIRKDLPVLIISGKDDPVGRFGKGPIKLAKLYGKYRLQNVSLKLFDGMRHEILNEDAKEMVYKEIAAFLK